jgi:cell division septum initiation protein DivIVA
MPIKPEQVNASKLPTALRGYDRDATDELLRRVAWDYLQVERAHTTAAEEADSLRQRVAELEQDLGSQQERFDHELRERTARLEAEVERMRRVLREHEQRDEMTRRLLVSAQRSAREMREAARAECESLLKAAQRRATEIEGEARTSLRHSLREVERLRKLEGDLKDQLRRMLESVIGGGGSDADEEAAVAEHLPPTTAVQ